MSQDLTVFDQAERMWHVVDNYVLKGQVNPTKIAKETGLTRVEVVSILEQWREVSAQSEWVQQRAQQALLEFDKTYDQIIAEYWKIYEDADTTRDQNAIMKNLSDAVKARQEVLQRAGMYDDAAVGDQLAVVEQQVEEIKQLMKDVAKNYPEARQFIMEHLGKIFKEAQRVDA